MHDRKAAAVILFLLQKAPDHRLGVSKLWKLLYYVDLLHREHFGIPVTSLEFVKDRHGPVPVGGAGLLEDMSEDGALSFVRVRRFSNYETTVCAGEARETRDVEFSERAVLEEITLDWMRATSGQLESAIRQSTPWKAGVRGNHIPFDDPAPVA